MSKRHVIGTVKRHPDGFGFLSPEDTEFPDVYIPRKFMRGIMSGDKVKVEAFPESRGKDRWRGEITEVISREVTEVIGQFHSLSGKKGLLLDNNFAWGDDLTVNTSATDKKIGKGDWVKVKIKTYPGSKKGFTGDFVEIVGNIVDPHLDTMRVLFGHKVPMEFNPKTLKEVEGLPEKIDPKKHTGRRDLQKLPFITIDGATAKDFDDAVCVKALDSGYKLYVAIADVSHYVKHGTSLEEDAYERGNSTYLPNFVVPMLPKVLSDGLCSLNPKTPRLAMVAEIDFDLFGRKTKSDFYEAIIYSHARVTYGEAQEVLDGSTPEELKERASDILVAKELADILMKKRFNEGAIDLDIGETEIVLDETGEPLDVIKSERLFAHRLIEEMMLAANVAVAEFISSKNTEVLYRVHDEPSGDGIAFLQTFAHNAGLLKSGKGSATNLNEKIATILKEAYKSDAKTVINMLTLRSMSQAKYSPDNVGHFGLGFDNYAHFTSPIRRYPDLVVHRVLKSLIYKDRRHYKYTIDDLTSAGVHCSATEQRSTKAEREIKSIKKARFMKRHIGKEFEGAISSIAKFGVFVLLSEFDVDGLIKLEQLEGGPFQYDAEKLCLRGKKKNYNLGDKFKIKVAAVDIDAGQIDFVAAGTYLPPTPGYSYRKKRKAGDSKKSSKESEKKGKKKFSKSFKPGKKKEDRHSSGKKSKKKNKKSSGKKGGLALKVRGLISPKKKKNS